MKKPLFVYLTAFSTNGGIEKFNKAFMKALVEQFPASKVASLYDKKSQIDERYISQTHFLQGYKNKLWGSVKIILKTIVGSSNILIFGHINLAPIALLIHKIMPKKKIVLITHGIEVWENINAKKQKLLEQSNKIFAVSSFTKKALIEKRGISAEKIEIFHNTIDPYFEQPAHFGKSESLLKRYQIKNDEKIILTLCRLSSNEAYKGYDKVIEALPLINNKVKNVKYLIVGKYDEKEKARIEEIAKKKGVESQLIFTGYVKDEEIVNHYLLGDIFIMPSRNEGFGIVFLEAMMCGLPVIAGNKDGSVDALKNGELGTLIDPKNEIKIANAIINALQKENDENLKKELQRKMLNEFSFAVFKKRLSEVL